MQKPNDNFKPSDMPDFDLDNIPELGEDFDPSYKPEKPDGEDRAMPSGSIPEGFSFDGAA